MVRYVILPHVGQDHLCAALQFLRLARARQLDWFDLRRRGITGRAINISSANMRTIETFSVVACHVRGG